MDDLLERDDLLRSLTDALGEGGRLVFVGGEAGVGKTALVRALEELAPCAVLHGSSESLATPTPFGPFTDIAATTGGALAELLRDGPTPGTVARAILDELEVPAVVVLEDVHRADRRRSTPRPAGRRIEQLHARRRDLPRRRGHRTHPLRIVLGDLASGPGRRRGSRCPALARRRAQLAGPHGVDAADSTRRPAAIRSSSPRCAPWPQRGPGHDP